MTSLTPVPHWAPCVLTSASCSSHGGCLPAASLRWAIEKALAQLKVAILVLTIMVALRLQACVQGEQPFSHSGFQQHQLKCSAQQAGPFWLLQDISSRSLVCALGHCIQGERLQAWQ